MGPIRCPAPPAENILRGEAWRITLLTPSLARLEYDPAGRFEDRPTQTVWNRSFPAVPHTCSRTAAGLLIRTEHMHIRYDETPFSPHGLRVELVGRPGCDAVWTYGDPPRDLGGTARTLDGADGAVALGSGVCSRWGIAVLDDSGSLLLEPDGTLQPRRTDVCDLYVFAYGHDYRSAVRDFTALCGPVPLLPRFALGNWWSRYHKYTQEEYLQLMDRFRREELPFSVAVIDMDWHLVDIDPKYGSGWTGFTWNEDLFPDHAAFLRALHARGLKVTLNLHPASGIRPSETVYPAVARRMGVDPGSGEPVPFDPCDAAFLRCYYEDVLHPMEDEGVDFWWVDWQQGDVSRVPGLDPLWALNHYDFLDSGRDGRRPMTFSRYAGPGSHRYPIGFSGDTVVSWASLRFQPYFTATAANIGYGWWSHDVGGHFHGVRDDELMARWTQLGVFSPIMRLHSSNCALMSKEPWNFSPETEAAMQRMLRLRHRMLPYLYTMNRLAHTQSLPLVQPLYYRHPDESWAYDHPNAYYFGTELLVLPITSPCIASLRLGAETLHLPDGVWHDVFTHRIYRGGRTLRVYRPLDQIPVFAKAGAILPLTDDIGPGSAGRNPEQLHICVYLGADGELTLYEDDNETTAYLQGAYAETVLSLRDGPAGTSFTVRAPAGRRELLPETRRYVVEFFGCGDCASALHVLADGAPVPAQTSYCPESRCLRAELPALDTGAELRFRFDGPAAALGNDVRSDVFSLLSRAQIAYDLKERLWNIIRAEPDAGRCLTALLAQDVDRELLGALSERLTAFL